MRDDISQRFIFVILNHSNNLVKALVLRRVVEMVFFGTSKRVETRELHALYRDRFIKRELKMCRDFES